MLVAAVASRGCGSAEEAGHGSVADTEGIYLDVGGLKYQIQMSRYLNPNDIEDREYLSGAARRARSSSRADEIWFGVCVRVAERRPTRPAGRPTTSEIHDTQDNVFRPIPVDTDINAVRLPGAGRRRRAPCSAARHALPARAPIQGSLLLFKIKTDSLQNRPLELRFSNGRGRPGGTYDLDV